MISGHKVSNIKLLNGGTVGTVLLNTTATTTTTTTTTTPKYYYYCYFITLQETAGVQVTLI